MSSTLTVLGLYGLLVLATLLVQATLAAQQVGIPMLLSDRSQMPKLTDLAGRMDRALNNSILSLAMFAPAVLILQAKGATGTGLLAAQIFLAMRVLYVLCYAGKINGFRSLFWGIGFGTTVWLYILGLTA